MNEQKNIVVADSLRHLRDNNYSFFCDDDCCSEYLVHALCTGGFCRFAFNGQEFELREGYLMIVRKGKLIEWMHPSADFKVKIIYITSDFISLCTPQSNYGMKGQLALFLNPVMRLTPEQQEVCRNDFRMIEQRLNDTGHHFRRDMPSERQIPDFRPYLRYVRILFASLLQPLCTAQSGDEPDRIQGMNRCRCILHHLPLCHIVDINY